MLMSESKANRDSLYTANQQAQEAAIAATKEAQEAAIAATKEAQDKSIAAHQEAQYKTQAANEKAAAGHTATILDLASRVLGPDVAAAEDLLLEEDNNAPGL